MYYCFDFIPAAQSDTITEVVLNHCQMIEMILDIRRKLLLVP
jgi:hypothetical protein